MAHTLAHQGVRASRISPKRFDQASTEKLALFAASAVFAVLALLIIPRTGSLLLQLIGVVLGTLSLGFLFLAFRWALTRLMVGSLLDPWVYQIYLGKTDEPWRQGYGVFNVSWNGTLSLEKHLYKTLDDAVRGAHGEETTAPPIAHFRSRSLACRSGIIDVPYQVDYLTEATRLGQLRLVIKDGRNVELYGTWHSISAEPGKDLTAGYIRMWRPNPLAKPG